ncbi:MAG: hypothetical protein PHQ52_04865 [Candidatus Omnitrophica bacterium]|nr:hypothetical protein [Candidatus Omnitrophota bacterium]
MNIFENIPYNIEKMGNRKVADQNDILIMQIALKPGQIVPLHKANSNVHLLILKGELIVELDSVDRKAKEGDLLPVKYLTPMTIKNIGSCDATFLVLKTPNPSQINKEKL